MRPAALMLWLLCLVTCLAVFAWCAGEVIAGLSRARELSYAMWANVTRIYNVSLAEAVEFAGWQRVEEGATRIAVSALALLAIALFASLLVLLLEAKVARG